MSPRKSSSSRLVRAGASLTSSVARMERISSQQTRTKSSLMQWLASLPETQSRKIIQSLPRETARQAIYEWQCWARPNQMPPAGDWTFWMLLAGRGFGKTRTGAEYVRAARKYYKRVALVGPTASDTRNVMVEGESGILA